MKINSFIVSALVGLAAVTSASASSVIVQNFGSGFTAADGTTAVTTGTVRMGVFDPATNFSDGSFGNLDGNFTEVASYTGVFNVFSTDGFVDLDLAYDIAGTFGGVPYDLSGDTTDVAGDLAGEIISMWVLNGGGTEQAVYSSNRTWTDGQTPLNNGSSFTPDSGPGVVALIGTLATGADIGAGAASNSLAAVPEPSRAVLGFLGLGVLFFRRRR